MVVSGFMKVGGSSVMSERRTRASVSSIGSSKPKRLRSQADSAFTDPSRQGIARMPMDLLKNEYAIAEAMESVSGC